LTALIPSLLVLAGLSLPGCGSGESATSTTDDATTPPAAPTVEAPTPAVPEGEDPDITAALAKLSPEDQAAARAQKKCPVGDGALGSMGAPVIVMAGEKKVFLCCEHCKESFEADPEKYLAKLSGGESENAPEGSPEAAPEARPERGAEPASGEAGT